MTLPRRATCCPPGSSNGGRSASCARPTPTFCQRSSTRIPAGGIQINALASTTTGRLSSFDPNLQNIPIRTEEGRKIRRAFIATPAPSSYRPIIRKSNCGSSPKLPISKRLKRAFREGTDIHALTASEMFGVPVKGMPGEVRRRPRRSISASIYGHLGVRSRQPVGIPREEAGAYIKKYFERFPGIRAFMDASKEACRKDGYVTTLFGRKCHYPDITASNPSIRSFNERAAVNARLQAPPPTSSAAPWCAWTKH